MEKKVILEEIAMYLDQPPYGADDVLKAVYFGDHPLSRSVLGTVDTISALTVENMRDYFERSYAPNNITVAAAGRVDFDALIEHVDARCGRWKGSTPQRDRPSHVPAEGFETVVREKSTQQYIMQVARAPDSQSPDRFTAKLLATILGDDSGSRMYWELVDPGIAEHASLGHYEYDDAGIFYTWASGDPEMAKEILNKLAETRLSLQTQPITASELAQAKSKLRARVVLSSERSRNRLFVVGGNWVQRQEYRSVADDLAAVDAVTLDDIERLLGEFPLANVTTVTVGPVADWD